MCFLCVLHPGSQEALEMSLEGPQKIHTKDYYIFMKVNLRSLNLFWLFSFYVLFRCSLLVCFLCMLHLGFQEALEESLEGPQKIHKQDYYIFLEVLKCIYYNLFWLFSSDVLFRCALLVCILCVLFRYDLLVCVLCMLHPGSQEALEGSIEGHLKIH